MAEESPSHRHHVMHIVRRIYSTASTNHFARSHIRKLRSLFWRVWCWQWSFYGQEYLSLAKDGDCLTEAFPRGLVQRSVPVLVKDFINHHSKFTNITIMIIMIIPRSPSCLSQSSLTTSSWWSTLAPCLTSCFTMSTWPSAAARCRAVCPVWSLSWWSLMMMVVTLIMLMVVLVVVMSNTHKILQGHVTPAKYESSHSLAMSGAGSLVEGCLTVLKIWWWSDRW